MYDRDKRGEAADNASGMQKAGTAREKSEGGIYHIMLRVIDRQGIFPKEEDEPRFLSGIGQCRELCGFCLFAYCLMGNHVHMLLQAERGPIEQVVKGTKAFGKR